jgi:hypothetical protein
MVKQKCFFLTTNPFFWFVILATVLCFAWMPQSVGYFWIHTAGFYIGSLDWHCNVITHGDYHLERHINKHNSGKMHAEIVIKKQTCVCTDDPYSFYSGTLSFGWGDSLPLLNICLTPVHRRTLAIISPPPLQTWDCLLSLVWLWPTF